MSLDNIIDDNTKARGIPFLKERYQKTIRELLKFSTYSGASFHELERFKQNFRTSAFTCRIWTCRHAVFGFNSIKDLMLHEADHRKYICHFPGCHYPVFSSARTLKGHIREVHAQSNRAVPRNSIRKRVQPSDLTLSLQQDVYAEAINAKRPAKIADDKNVNQNLEKDKLSIVTQTSQIKEDDDKDNITEDDEYNATTFSPSRKNASLNRILKSRSITHSRGGVPLTAKRGRNKRRDYPSSWGFNKGQMIMKKRIMSVFDGPWRFTKDDLMLSTD